MARTSPLDAAMWSRLVEDDGEVRCRGCDTMVDLSSADDINDAVDCWNEHVQDCPNAIDAVDSAC